MLYNSGKVDMDFTTFGVSDKADLVPGGISVQPATVCNIQRLRYNTSCVLFSQGHIPALDNMTLTVHFLPGVPEEFKKVFQVSMMPKCC